MSDFTHEDAYKQLKRLGYLELNNNRKAVETTKSGYEFTKIHIPKTDYFDDLLIESKVISGKKILFSALSLSVNDKETANLFCYNVSEYLDRLDTIEFYAKFNYGIDLDLTEAKLKSIEINKTIKLEHDYYDYSRVFRLIIANIKGMSNKSISFKDICDCEKAGTYYVNSKRSYKSKRYIEMKIYNKTEQLQKIVLLDDSTARFEFKIFGSDKIKKELGTDLFLCLTDKSIEKWYQSKINDLIIEPLDSWRVNSRKYQLKVMLEEYAENQRYWVINTLRRLENDEALTHIPKILDVDELIRMIDVMPVDLDRRKKYNAKQSFKKQATKYENIFCLNSSDKLYEVLSKLINEEMAADFESKDNYLILDANVLKAS